jgi:hypothetical protein
MEVGKTPYDSASILTKPTYWWALSYIKHPNDFPSLPSTLDPAHFDSLLAAWKWSQNDQIQSSTRQF